MKIIKECVDRIEEEICSAKDYAEMYVDWKSRNDTYWSSRFHEASLDELKHAEYIHDLSVKEIERLSKIYTPPAEMLEKWEKSHKKYIEKTTWIKTMLAM